MVALQENLLWLFQSSDFLCGIAQHLQLNSTIGLPFLLLFGDFPASYLSFDGN